MKWLIKRYMVEEHIDTLSELARLSGIARRTLYDRIREPQTFRLFELIALDNVLHFNDDDLAKLARGQFWK